MTKRALLVGVNDYRGISDLRGCVNDVTNVRNVLKTYYGYTNADIRVLVDDRANKANILQRLEGMVAVSEAGDTLTFHFSGHGSQIRDRNGDELEDGMDELICPWDMNWDNGFITDDTLNDVFTPLKDGVHLEVILDCCHSGTAMRDIGLGRPAELGPENPTLSRFLPPPVDIRSRHEGEEDELATPRTFRGGSTSKHILWSGCRADQTSADAFIGGTYNGAFSFYFCKHIREAAGRVGRKDLLTRVRNSLGHQGYSQVPQLDLDALRDGQEALRS